MIEPTKLLVIELRAELRDRNLDSNGRKIDLISRLQFALDDERRREQRENTDYLRIVGETNESSGRMNDGEHVDVTVREVEGSGDMKLFCFCYK